MTVLPGSLSHLLGRDAQLEAVVLGEAGCIFEDGGVDRWFKMPRLWIQPILYIAFGRDVDVDSVILEVMLSIQATEVAGEKFVPVISRTRIRGLVSISTVSDHIHVHILHVIDTSRQQS